MSTVTLASIYERQGLKDEALKIYKNVLRKEPENVEAQEAIKRILGMKKQYKDANEQMRDFFINIDDDVSRNEFERWLIKLWN